MDNETAYPLYSLLIEVTQKCNANCDQCGSRCDIHSEEKLTKEQILSALRDIKDHIGTYTMLNITGGEPLLRHDLFEMMGEASNMGFEWGMVSNGSLITDSVIQKMKESGMKTITISLDGLRETHDTLRHLPGCFDRIMTALQKLKAAAFLDHLQVTFTANRKNVREFPALLHLLQPLGLDSVRVSAMDPIGRALDNRELLLTREEILWFTGVIDRWNRNKSHVPVIWGCPHFLGNLLPGRRFFCFAGIYTASILHNGDIFVCPNVPRRPELLQGNILRDSFSEVWQTGFSRFRNRTLPEKCKTCEFKDCCKGDSFHTMDFDKGEPLFCYRDFLLHPDPARYQADLFARNPGVKFYEIAGDDADAFELFFEPDAFRSVSQYFHLGRRHPQSMFEQQMAMFGFINGNMGAVRYVAPCDGAFRAADNAVFTKKILKTVDKELAIVNNNYEGSDDALLAGRETDRENPMRFLGFIHSHPTQPELQYSTGDETIHNWMLKKYGFYAGVLVHPQSGALGAYFGKDLKQAKLIVPETDPADTQP